MNRNTDDIQKVIALLAELAAKHGLVMETEAILLPRIGTDGPLVIQGMFTIHERPIAPDADQAKIDAAFQALVSGQDDAASKVETLREQMERDFKDGKGIFGD